MEKVNVKLRRIKLGKTQEQIRKEVKISPRKLVEAERGNYEKLTFANMIAIAKALETDVQTLFFSEEN